MDKFWKKGQSWATGMSGKLILALIFLLLVGAAIVYRYGPQIGSIIGRIFGGF